MINGLVEQKKVGLGTFERMLSITSREVTDLATQSGAPTVYGWDGSVSVACGITMMILAALRSSGIPSPAVTAPIIKLTNGALAKLGADHDNWGLDGSERTVLALWPTLWGGSGEAVRKRVAPYLSTRPEFYASELRFFSQSSVQCLPDDQADGAYFGLTPIVKIYADDLARRLRSALAGKLFFAKVG